MQHLEEGTIHAWLDGELSPNEASAIEIHVQTCEHCARAVAEARGLVAASSRILGALDHIPSVQTSAGNPGSAARRSGWWWSRAGIGYAAAATVLLAAGTTLVLRNLSPDAAFESVAPAQGTAASVPLLDSAQSGKEQASSAPAASGARADKNAKARRQAAVSPQEQKEELTVDKVVPLPGPMPRVAAPAPPPSVRQEARKAVAADVAANEALSGAVVQGRVLDAATGTPVAGAIVRIDSTSNSARTDAAGRFQLQQVPLGTQTVKVQALGFQAAQHSVDIARSDSVQLGFALQKASMELSSVVVTGAAAARERTAAPQRAGAAAAGERRDSLDTRFDASAIAGCYVLQVSDDKRDADRKNVASIPTRVQLGVSPFDDQGSRRALTLEGVGRAQSWRMISGALELTWRDPATAASSSARFVASGGTWTGMLTSEPGVNITMQRCGR